MRPILALALALSAAPLPAAAQPTATTTQATETAKSTKAMAPQAAGCKLIRTAAQLQSIRQNLAGSYCLANDIDASSIANFVPIGAVGMPFTGKLHGNGRVIRNLSISSAKGQIALFGVVSQALIQDVGLVNVDIVGTTDGALVAGLVAAPVDAASEIRRVYVTGRVAALGLGSYAAGIAAYAQNLTLTDSWSSADIEARFAAGGAIGWAGKSAITRVYATGSVACGSPVCAAGGLIGNVVESQVVMSHAGGPTVGADSSRAGGLIGRSVGSTVWRSYALGPVQVGGVTTYAGGLIGRVEGGLVTEVYAVGPVSGAAGAVTGGLIGAVAVMVGGDLPTIRYAYWDKLTSKQTMSAAGVGYTTKQLRNSLPPDFSNVWAFSRRQSYPFIDDTAIDFTAPLATLVAKSRIFTFLPISQHGPAEYLNAPAHADAASLAAAYAMIARAIGITRNVTALKGVKVDKYFWNDATKAASWQGPVTTRATLGTLVAIANGEKLSNANVIGAMKNGQLVLLRGRYSAADGKIAEHWLLGTLFTSVGNAVDAVIANDPWTGEQVMIDPATKQVVSPADFPLANLKINGFQPVTLN